jgi:hypothetical protein
MAKNLDLAGLKERIHFYPHAVQKEILKGMGRFTVVASAKRLGKSKLAAYLAFKEMFIPRHVVWIIGPNYELASRVWDYVAEWIDMYFDGEQGPFRVNRHDRIIENTRTGAKMWMKTTEEPTSLLGKGLDLAIVDEAARIDEGIWDGYIRPNLMDKKGRALLISNPYGYNWFYDQYLHGLPENRKEFPDYVSFHFPTAIEDENGEIIGTNNPYAVDVSELEAIKRSYPRDVWIVEYLGEFREGAGQRFKNFEQCIDDTVPVPNPYDWFEDPIPGHLYFVGVDIAKVEDFTVICIVDRMTHRLVGFYRTNNVSWHYMRDKIVEFSKKYYDAEITLDATGHGGDMFAENLSEIGANIDTEFTYTNRSKTMMIDKLSLFMERGQLRFPKIPQLIDELRSFTYHITDSGNMKLGSSRKDDCVNALALACWNLNDEPLIKYAGMQNIFKSKQRTFS